ncbi:hypothetical protein CKO_02232 [Citrobacter koseri ATCC BAA-895]|uniref:Uncharacterized protein n=1 Tax=Citrobacter koseri (strain ATCC BAA-895 / CDC 4225-83 / SGSC4696) TaxID=290338 RepID=A8AIP2_CITK8|nr:hypothetical protein CKO_02232 [Citrobacter koseri ATCC BAA-895]
MTISLTGVSENNQSNFLLSGICPNKPAQLFLAQRFQKPESTARHHVSASF